MTEPRKRFFSYNDIHRTVARLAGMVQADGYQADVIVAIGSGGFIPARILKTYLKKPIYTVGVALYDDATKQPASQPRKIQWIDEVERKLGGQRILLVDEVDDSRKTLAYCVRELLAHQPASLAVAVLHCKEKPKLAEFPPELAAYWAGEYLPDDWLVYPWDVLAPDGAGPDGSHGLREQTGRLLLDFGPDGTDLVPVVTQDAATREVLILSWVNRQAWEETWASGFATYWSRSRQTLWKKGDTSGNHLRIRDIRINCEQNSLLFVVDQEGEGACHARRPDGQAWHGCYYRQVRPAPDGAAGDYHLVPLDVPPYSG